MSPRSTNRPVPDTTTSATETQRGSRDTRGATPAGTRRFARRYQDNFSDFYRPLSQQLTVSSLGIGTYLGDCTDGEDARYEESIRDAIASGVNVVDTASNYRCQRSERVVGRAIGEAIAAGTVRRDELVICTKGGYVALDTEPPASVQAYEQWLEETLYSPGIVTADQIVRGGHSLAPRFIEHQLSQSRTNLGVERIDLYYLHNPEEQLLACDGDTFRGLMRAAFAVLEERVSAGEIAGYGCATWLGLRVPPDNRQHLSLADLIAVARDVGGTAHHFRAVQLPVNLAMPEAARLPTQLLGRKLATVLEAADALGLSVIASASLLQGKLTDGLPDALHTLFPSCTTDAQRALRFVSSLPGISTVLAGMRNTDHLRENLGAWSVESVQ